MQDEYMGENTPCEKKSAIMRRALFAAFPKTVPIPKTVKYIGGVIPPAAFGMLVVYCFKDISITEFPHALPELIASSAVVLLHLWRKNTLLSIGAGTVIYMLLVQLVF